MAPSCREIPQEEWEQHKVTILNLRYGQKLPLDNPKRDGQSIIQIMRNNHQFEATVSQYEAQLRKWEAPKNLKKRDWESILPLYDQLMEQGLEPRVRLGDQVLDENRVKRARRYVKPGNTVFREPTGLALSSAQDRLWRIDARPPGGQYTEYSVSHGETTTLDGMHGPNPVFVEISTSPVQNTGQLVQDYPAWPVASPSLVVTRSPNLSNFQLSLNSPRFSLDNVEELFLPQDTSTYELHPEYDWLTPGSPLGSGAYDPVLYMSLGRLQPQWTLSKDCIETMLLKISRESVFGKLGLYRNIPDAEDILDILESLVPTYFFDDRREDGGAFIWRKMNPISDIHKRIVFSIANNFAGLQDIPPSIVLGILKIDPEMSSCLFQSLQSDEPTIAKPLTENLFRLAIEAGDEEAVTIILKTTLGRANQIDPNQIICQFEGHFFTPLALASHFHHLGIVKRLLGQGASVDKTKSRRDSFINCCALTSLVPTWARKIEDFHDKPEVIQITELLLFNGARVEIPWFGRLIRRMNQSPKLIETLFYAISKERHHELFKSYKPIPDGPPRQMDSILSCIADSLEGHLVNTLMRRLMETCQDLDCSLRCIVASRKNLDEFLATVAMKGNYEISKYILRYTKPQIHHLVAAIHGGWSDLIDQILKQGVCPHGTAVCARHMNQTYKSCKHKRYRHREYDAEDCEPTTPWAEAVRSQNCDVIRRLENSGALDGVSANIHEFKAALLAISEVRSLSYLKQFLRLGPAQNLGYVWRSIAKAIDADHWELAKVLIAHLASQTEIKDSSEAIGALLLLTVRKRNRDIFSTILEYLHVDCTGMGDSTKSLIIKAAVQWGETSVVEDLLQFGIYDKTDPTLRYAIEAGNTKLVALLLESGFEPSGLAETIKIGDEKTMRLLLHYGADLEEKDFLEAVRSGNRLLLAALLRVFASRYPYGKKGTCRKAIKKAILTRDSSALGDFIHVKMDISSYKLSSRWDDDHEDCEDITYDNALTFAIRHSNEGDLEMSQIICRLLDAGVNPETVSPVGRTALLSAIKAKNAQAVKLLLSHGVDINQPARRVVKRTPLQQACEEGSFRIVEFLINSHADVNAPPATNGGGTALQLAAIQGSVKIVKLLLDNGANIHAASAVFHGRTALEGAAEHGRISVLNILLAEGAAGYTVEDIEKAKAYAEKAGQTCCAKRLNWACFRIGVDRASRASLML